MKCRTLMTGLIGLALLAAPITAAAKDYDNGNSNSRQPQSESRSSASTTRSQEHANAPARNAAPAMETRHESRDQGAGRAVNTAPAQATRNENRDQRVNRDENRGPAVTENREGRAYGDEHDRGDRGRGDGDRWNHNHDYDYGRAGAPYYEMPRGYAGGACAWARHLRVVYNQDRYSGHPAAAEDLLPRLRNAERACGGVPYGYLR